MLGVISRRDVHNADDRKADNLMTPSIQEKGDRALSNKTLSILPSSVKTPNYNRSHLKAGIIHIGIGNFHRAHLAWYLHRLMQKGLAIDWAIIGAGVRQGDSVMRARLLKQDCLTTLIELDAKGNQAMEVTGAMIDYLPVEANNHALIKAMADPDIRIVSLTITEGGYYQDPATGKLDITHPDILYDAKHPARPRTAFGAMVAALRARRDRGAGPFTGLSCDNLQSNGAILRQAIIGLAELSDAELAAWIDYHCSFPNSMVDCIVPATGPAEFALVKKLGIEDNAPVTHEDFRQWVIEDNFCAGRPDWDKVGAEFSQYVHHHETQKIRMLNGGHQILANTAEIMGLHTISQAMRHPLIGAMFAKVQQEEILPHITPPPGHDVSDYLTLISTRFANEAIIDTVRRVAFDGAARHVGFILPSLRDGLTENSSITGLALIEAIWARMCLGLREDGSVIEANDPSWEMLIKIAWQARTTPRCWLEMSHIYGDLNKEERFTSAFEEALSSLYQNGIEHTITAYLARPCIN